MTFALLGLIGIIPALAAGQQLAEPAVSRAVARIDQNVRRAIDKDEARTDQKFWFVYDVRMIEFLVGPHYAGQRVVIGNADHGKTQPARLLHVSSRIRPAAQERKVRRGPDFGIVGRVHANSPCTKPFYSTSLT